MNHKKACKIRFCCKYPAVGVPVSSVIFKLVKKVQSAGSFLDKEFARQNAVLTEENMTELEPD